MWASRPISPSQAGGCGGDRNRDDPPDAEPSGGADRVVKHYDSPRLWPRRSGLPPGLTIGLLLGEELLDEIGDHRGAPGVLVHQIGGQLQPAATGDAVE